MKGRLRLAAVLAASALAVAACGGDDEEAAPPVEDATTTVATEAPPATDTGGETETGDGGDATGGDPANGAEVFASAGCGSCHTFEAAGSSGTVGPNLDESDADFDAAVEQIRQGGNGMPAYEGQLSEQEILDVAAFVVEERS